MFKILGHLPYFGNLHITPSKPQSSASLLKINTNESFSVKWFVCAEILRPSQPIGVMSSTVRLPYHTFLGRLSPQKPLTVLVHIFLPEKWTQNHSVCLSALQIKTGTFANCRSRWDGSLWAVSSGSTLFVITFLIFNSNPCLQQWMCPNLNMEE